MVFGRRSVHLVFGASGQLGYELARQLGKDSSVVAPGRSEVDFLKPETLTAAVHQYRPQFVWNAAAATNVDALESDPILAFQVNADAVGVLAESARRLGSVLIHFSTDYVFDGSKPGPYGEEDLPHPLNVYGSSKLAGERVIEQVGGRWLALRTSWLYSIRGRNFLRAITRKGMDEDRVGVVDDQVGAPTEASQLARACLVMCRVLADDAAGRLAGGLYHVAAGGSTTWWEFASAIRDELVGRGARWKAVIEPISTKLLGRPARRPANSCLATERFEQTFNASMLPWRVGLATMLDEAAEGWWNDPLPITDPSPA